MITRPAHIRGFSLLEVLLAMFILGIGLVMVATIFPVGANWTRQASEDSVAQTVALNAVSVIKDAYSSTGINSTSLASSTSPQGTATSSVVAIPGLTNLSISQRCYRYGNDTPFPVSNPIVCTYYWTALIRPVPVATGQATTGPGRAYDLYILVFRKGDANHTFTPSGKLFDSNNAAFLNYSSGDEVTVVRDPPGAVTNFTGYDGKYEPTVIHHAYSAGTSAVNGTDAIPPIGYIGIGTTSGTVFRQVYDYKNNVAAPRPATAGNEDVIFAPPADGTSGSPLVYVYQTTVTF